MNLKRFRRERIEISVPDSVVRIRQDGARGDATLVPEPALLRAAEDGLN